MGGLAARAVPVEVKAVRFMTQHVQQRIGKRHAGHKCQAVITDAQGADLFLPLLQGVGLAARWELGAGLTGVQVFSVQADWCSGSRKAWSCQPKRVTRRAHIPSERVRPKAVTIGSVKVAL